MLEHTAKIVHVWEAHDVYMGRPSIYGNPFSHKEKSLAKYKVATREEAVDKHEEWLLTQPELIEIIKKELPGKVLACWCRAGEPCHVRIIFKIANGYYPDEESPVEKTLF